MTEVKNFRDLGVTIPESDAMEGPSININKLFGREITVHRYVIKPTIIEKSTNPDCLWMQISIEGNMRVVFSGSAYLQKMIKQIPYPQGFPFKTTIVKKDNDSHQFT